MTPEELPEFVSVTRPVENALMFEGLSREYLHSLREDLFRAMADAGVMPDPDAPIDITLESDPDLVRRNEFRMVARGRVIPIRPEP